MFGALRFANVRIPSAAANGNDYTKVDDSLEVSRQDLFRAYGTFPRILRKYVREENQLTLPDASAEFSALPAQRMRLIDRGVLKQGMWANVVVFDPATIRDKATFEDPNQFSEGMEYVLVNGVPVIAGGKMTSALPGKVLRGPGYEPGNELGFVP